jgi:hypothetical protein
MTDLTPIRAEIHNRQACIDCGRKHVAKARAKLVEAPLGYPRHAWYAVGELAEAEDELVAEYPECAAAVREARLALMASLDPLTSVGPDGDLVVDPQRLAIPNWDALLDLLIRAAIE